MVSVDKYTASRLHNIRQIDAMKWQEPRAKTLLRPGIHDWSIKGDFMDSGFNSVWLWYVLGVTVATGLYGGLHVTAWHFLFPSKTETLLWRAASLTVTLGGLALLCVNSIFALVDRIHHWSKDNSWQERLAFVMAAVMVCVTLWATILWYCFCRAFLVVESFICLAHLPEAALEVPSWSKYVPDVT